MSRIMKVRKIPFSQIAFDFTNDECSYKNSKRCLINESGSLEKISEWAELIYKKYPNLRLDRESKEYCLLLAYSLFVKKIGIKNEICLFYDDFRKKYCFYDGRHRFCIAKKLNLLGELKIKID